jgi:hypothetical protein
MLTRARQEIIRRLRGRQLGGDGEAVVHAGVGQVVEEVLQGALASEDGLQSQIQGFRLGGHPSIPSMSKLCFAQMGGNDEGVYKLRQPSITSLSELYFAQLGCIDE